MGRPATLPTVAAARPDLALDWHPDNDRPPTEVSVGAKYRAKWKCRNPITFRGNPRACGYEWHNAVANRARSGQGCPACAGKAASDWNNLVELHPAVAAEWAPQNDLSADQVTAGSGYRAYWICADCSREWRTTPDKRTNRGHDCPDCSKYGSASARNNLFVLGPGDVVRDWHDKNENPPTAYRPQSPYRAWWRCGNTITVAGAARLCGHEWRQTINRRFNGVGCPACAGKAASDWNNLSVTHPHLLSEWAESNMLRPLDVTHGSKKRVLWRCSTVVDKFGVHEPCGYEWATSVHNRVIGKGCPACCGHVTMPWTSIAALHPDSLAEWAEDNTKSAHDLNIGTNYRATWICSNQTTINGTTVTCGHRWKTRPHNRLILGTGCPECMLWATSSDEILLAHELAAFFTVDNTGRKVRGSTQTWKADIVIPEHKVIVEYDGSYWHRDHHDRDLRKSEDLTAAGWTVIRAREHPLTTLTPNDVPCRSGHHKATADAVLRQIEALTGVEIPGLPEYLQQSALRNRAAAVKRIKNLRANVLANRARRRLDSAA